MQFPLPSHVYPTKHHEIAWESHKIRNFLPTREKYVYQHTKKPPIKKELPKGIE